MDTKQQPIYRFKFSDEMIERMKEFSRIHKFDDRNDFKESWQTWTKENSNTIDKEQKRLETLGFHGDIHDKMYKSIRYYYCKKSNVKQQPKQRRKYISLNKEILFQIDRHIENNIEVGGSIKPSVGFEDFITNIYNNSLTRYNDELKTQGLSNEDIHNKLKKTYKNRYFVLNHNKDKMNE